jgi:hypothetical protein
MSNRTLPITPLVNAQLDWSGENEFGVYFYHSQNETIPEHQRIQPKVSITSMLA